MPLFLSNINLVRKDRDAEVPAVPGRGVPEGPEAEARAELEHCEGPPPHAVARLLRGVRSGSNRGAPQRPRPG